MEQAAVSMNGSGRPELRIVLVPDGAKTAKIISVQIYIDEPQEG
jgi:hypothetical protein